MLRQMLALTLAVGATAGMVSLGSALFTDTQAVGANTFTAGRVEISTNPVTAAVTMSNMAPGDTFAAPITVSNDASTLELRYSVRSVTTEDVLAAQLDLTIYSGVSAANCSLKDFSAGTAIYTAAAIGSVAGINVVGDPTAGLQAGDRTMSAVAADEVLCFNVSLPQGTDDSFQGLTTTATFTFNAEQTANNG